MHYKFKINIYQSTVKNEIEISNSHYVIKILKVLIIQCPKHVGNSLNCL